MQFSHRPHVRADGPNGEDLNHAIWGASDERP